MFGALTHEDLVEVLDHDAPYEFLLCCPYRVRALVLKPIFLLFSVRVSRERVAVPRPALQQPCVDLLSPG